MSKLEKKIIISVILFVIVYIGAIVATLQSRHRAKHREMRIESTTAVTEEEARIVLAELLAPMAVLLTLAICFIIARKRRTKDYSRLDEAGQETQNLNSNSGPMDDRK